MRIEKGFKGAKMVGIVLDSLSHVGVTVNAGSNSGTATVPEDATVVGIFPAGNQDQFIDTVTVSGTTLTVTLAANATANNIFTVTIME